MNKLASLRHTRWDLSACAEAQFSSVTYLDSALAAGRAAGAGFACVDHDMEIESS